MKPFKIKIWDDKVNGPIFKERFETAEQIGEAVGKFLKKYR